MDGQSSNQCAPLDCKQMLQLLTEFNQSHAHLKGEYDQKMRSLSARGFKTESTQYKQKDQLLKKQLDNLETKFKQRCRLSFKLGENPKIFMLGLLIKLNSSCQELTTTYNNTMHLWYNCKTKGEETMYDKELRGIEAKINEKKAEFATEHNLILNGFVVGTPPNEHILDIID